jgi:hypothetical protein
MCVWLHTETLSIGVTDLPALSAGSVTQCDVLDTKYGHLWLGQTSAQKSVTAVSYAKHCNRLVNLTFGHYQPLLALNVCG